MRCHMLLRCVHVVLFYAMCCIKFTSDEIVHYMTCFSSWFPDITNYFLFLLFVSIFLKKKKKFDVRHTHKQVVKEALRKASVVQWLPRVALEDCVIEGNT